MQQYCRGVFIVVFFSHDFSVSFFKTRQRTLLEIQGMHKSLPLKVKGAFEIVPYLYKTYSVFCIVIETKISSFSGVDLIYCTKI